MSPVAQVTDLDHDGAVDSEDTEDDLMEIKEDPGGKCRVPQEIVEDLTPFLNAVTM